MRKFAPRIMFLCVAGMMVGCATLSGPRENLNFSMPKDSSGEVRQHKYFKEFDFGNAYLMRFVFEGQSIDDWSEAMEVINTWKKNFPKSPEEAYKQVLEKRKKMCPEASFHVISQDNNSILYEIKTVNCPPHPDEHSITRLLYGRTDVFNLIYTNKTKDLPKETREEWIRILSDAWIRTGNLPSGYEPIRK